MLRMWRLKVREMEMELLTLWADTVASLRFESCRFHCNVCNFGKLRHAEGTGQENVAQNMHAVDEGDASGNRLLLDVGLWLTQKVKDHFTKVKKMEIDMKYIDPTYMIRALPSNASDSISCTLLAQSAVHGAMARYTGFSVGPVNSRRAYIPIARVTEAQNTVKLTEDVGQTACFYKSA